MSKINKYDMLLQRKVYEMAPKMIAAFALVLYENTDLSTDDIEDLCNKVAPLYERAKEEGWDIRKNCYDLTGISCYHEKEAIELGILPKEGEEDGTKGAC